MLWMNHTKPMYTSHSKKYRKVGATNLKGIIKTQCHYLSEQKKKSVQRCIGEYRLSEQDPSSQHFHSILIYQSEHTIKITQKKSFLLFLHNKLEREKVNNGIKA
jgi:hypothetical protein